MIPKRPLVRYHGGKWLLAPWIISHFPEHRIYCEPFGGGGSVLLRKPAVYAEVYNDLDGEIVNLFRVARDHGEKLAELLRLTPYARAEFDTSYKTCDDQIEQARRTVVRSFMGRGSNAHNIKTGFRAVSNNSGTTPAKDWTNYPDALHGIVARMRGVVIENRDATAVMQAQDSEQTLHYVDPPYVASTRDAGNDYSHEMDDSDHEQLLGFLSGLKGAVVLSGYQSEIYADCLPGWRMVTRKALADGARPRIEALWMNFNGTTPVMDDMFGKVTA